MELVAVLGVSTCLVMSRIHPQVVIVSSRIPSKIILGDYNRMMFLSRILEKAELRNLAGGFQKPDDLGVVTHTLR
jgi:hypothetical protein